MIYSFFAVIRKVNVCICVKWCLWFCPFYIAHLQEKLSAYNFREEEFNLNFINYLRRPCLSLIIIINNYSFETYGKCLISIRLQVRYSKWVAVVLCMKDIYLHHQQKAQTSAHLLLCYYLDLSETGGIGIYWGKIIQE